MNTLAFILGVASFIVLLYDAFADRHPRWGLQSFGLALFTAAWIVQLTWPVNNPITFH